MSISKLFLQSAIKRLGYYKDLGDKTIAQLSNPEFHFQPNSESNTMAIIIQHMAGNMLSRWTDFLTTDGEKEWRNRDGEFEDQGLDKDELVELWNTGWDCLFNTLKGLHEEDLLATISIRAEELTVVDAINRQLAHYPYHVGQMIYLGKMIRDSGWVNLSMPKR